MTINVSLWQQTSALSNQSKKQRWNPVKKSLTEITQPGLIYKYNKHMGGNDLLDGFLSTYRPIFRSETLWWPLFINGFNVMVVAACRMHVSVESLINSSLDVILSVVL